MPKNVLNLAISLSKKLLIMKLFSNLKRWDDGSATQE